MNLKYPETTEDKTVSAPQITKENSTENTNTMTTKRCNSALGVQETLVFNSSNESLIYVINAAISVFFQHGLRGSNSRHLVLETSALPTELNPSLHFLW